MSVLKDRERHYIDKGDELGQRTKCSDLNHIFHLNDIVHILCGAGYSDILIR